MELLFEVVLRIPPQMIACIALAVMLKVEHKAWYYTLALILVVVSPFIGLVLPNFVKFVFSLSWVIISPLIFSRQNLARKIFLCLLMFLALLISEMAASFYWLGSGFAITPVEGMMHAATAAYSLLAFAISWGVLSVLSLSIYLVDRRISKTRTDEGATVFAWFISSQVLIAVLSIGLGLSDLESSILYVDGFAVIVLLFIAADALCFYYLEKYNQEILRRRHALFLEKQIEANFEQYALLEQQVKTLGRARHDARNQVSVINMLVAKGDREGALRHFDELIEEVKKMIEQLTPVMRASLVAGGGEEAAVLSSAARASLADGAAGETSVLHPGADDAGRDTEDAPGLVDAIMQNAGRNENLARHVSRVARIALPLSQLIALVYLLVSFAITSAPPNMYIALAVVAAFCIVGNAVAFRAIKETTRRGETIETIRLLEEQRVSQRAYIESVDARLHFEEQRRDDFLRTLEQVRESIAHGRTEGIAQELTQAIDAVGGGGGSYCENKVVNVLLASKMWMCRHEGLETVCRVVVPEDFFVSSVDLCALFSNMIDNAINACRKVETEGRGLEVKARVMAGMFMVEVVNDCLSADAKALTKKKAFSLDEMFEGGQLREHGWGMHIVETLAVRYGGLFEIAPEGEGKCRATVMIPVSDAGSKEG